MERQVFRALLACSSWGGGGVGAFCSVVMHGVEPAVTYLDLIRISL
jgi:hypothetical protein